MGGCDVQRGGHIQQLVLMKLLVGCIDRTLKLQLTAAEKGTIIKVWWQRDDWLTEDVDVALKSGFEA